MRDQADNHQHVRHLTLPSGRQIDVVYFEGEHPREGDEALHICGSCDAEFVLPLEWSPVGKRHWRVTLRCPSCEWIGTGVFDQDTVDRFDAELERGAQRLIHDLEALTAANMSDELESFVAALQADLILPSDF